MFPIAITQGHRGNRFLFCEKIFTNNEYNAM